MPGRASLNPVGRLWRVVSDGTEHRVLPDGAMDFVLVEGLLLFAGPDTRASSVGTPPGTITWGVRLAPGIAHALLGCPVSELVNARVNLADLMAVSGAIADAAWDTPATALDELTRHLWERVAPHRADLDFARSLNRTARAGCGVRETAEKHGITERQLHRHSVRLFGYGMATLRSIHRFQRALHLARAGTPLAAAAAQAGYADQSHLARETRRFAGTTVRALIG